MSTPNQQGGMAYLDTQQKHQMMEYKRTTTKVEHFPTLCGGLVWQRRHASCFWGSRRSVVKRLSTKTLEGVELLCSEVPMMTCLDSSSSCCREHRDEGTSSWQEEE